MTPASEDDDACGYANEVKRGGGLTYSAAREREFDDDYRFDKRRGIRFVSSRDRVEGRNRTIGRG
jgi:hypothetical protein